MLEKLGPLNCWSAIDDVQTIKQEIEAKEDLVASTIHTSFDELHQILDDNENKLFLKALRKMQDNKTMTMHTEIKSSM